MITSARLSIGPEGRMWLLIRLVRRKKNTKEPRARISQIRVRMSLRDRSLKAKANAFEGKNIENEAPSGMEARFDKDDEGGRIKRRAYERST